MQNMDGIDLRQDLHCRFIRRMEVQNDIIYLDRTILEQSEDEFIDEFFIHETIHALQKFGSSNKRTGLCFDADSKPKGIGLNEAVIHYMSSKAVKMVIERVPAMVTDCNYIRNLIVKRKLNLVLIN